jgi:thiosulfate/3-mercaptopyruvate sulfurtransferase
MGDRRARYLVETQWLQDHLGDANLRVLDCTVFLQPVESGGVRPESGRAQWEQKHIPGAGFADLLGDLSDRTTQLPIMMPPAEQFAEAMERYGVGDDSRVVLYDTAANMWAARLWWMLRAFGFDRAAILNGGWKKWTAENRPVSSGTGSTRARGRFTPRAQQGLIADWREVQAVLNDPGVRLVNALTAEEHTGKLTRVSRPGHIPGSVNVPAGTLVDPVSNAYLDSETLQRTFERTGMGGTSRIITYCGGGIAACTDAFALTLIGADDVAVYDGSLVEWSSKPELPMQTDSSSR